MNEDKRIQPIIIERAQRKYESAFILEGDTLISVERFAIDRESGEGDEIRLIIPRERFEGKELWWIGFTRHNKVFVYRNIRLQNFDGEGYFRINVPTPKSFKNKTCFYQWLENEGITQIQGLPWRSRLKGQKA